MKKMVLPGVKIKCLIFLLLLCLVACTTAPKQTEETTNTATQPKVVVPQFNADSAYSYVAQQVAFGPRVPNSKSHVRCGDWLIEELKKYCDTVYVQSYQVKAFDGKMLNSRNIIGAFAPDAGNRILLAAHWDTRPFADQDTVRKNEPIDGANDGASGVGVLLEVARQLKAAKSKMAVDIILFDAEDYGQPDDSNLPYMEDSYCLGSQYWAKNLHVQNYFARFGVLLDMVGAANSKFTQEGTSMRYAPEIVNLVWQTASNAGFGDYFIQETTKGIIDDHYYINGLAHMKVVDIIHYDYNTRSNFWKHWHTHGDSIDKIDRNTLRATGQTILEVLYRQNA
jgi:glutaminyl-peptide cyclotransferase